MPIPDDVQQEFKSEMDKYEDELTAQLVAAGRADDEGDDAPLNHRAETLLLNSASVGAAGLIVSDLRRSLNFYAGVVGLDVLSHTGTSAQLGVAADRRLLLELEQRPGVDPLQGKRLGLYHTAVLLPSRAALASFAEHLALRGIRAGSSNHLVSEAFYLVDPDGLEIEVYADTDRSGWPWKGSELDGAVLPLDLRDLLASPHSVWSGVPSGTTMGHIHLYVGDLKQADRLYRTGLGLKIRTRNIPGALFLAAGDYHHHVGLNTWAGQAPVAGDCDPRLDWWSLEVPKQQVSALRNRMIETGWRLRPDGLFADPCGSALKLQPVNG